MGIITKETIKASIAAKARNNIIRRKLAARWGGKVGDYYPKRIINTMSIRNIPIAEIPAALIVKKKEMVNQESFPLDHPIFDSPEPKEKRSYMKRETTKKSGEVKDNREVVLRLIALIERLV